MIPELSVADVNLHLVDDDFFLQRKYVVGISFLNIHHSIEAEIFLVSAAAQNLAAFVGITGL